MGRGLFIVFEGLDGNGKTTQVRLLQKYLKDKGKDVISTREPGGTPVGEEIREILSNKDYSISPLTELFLFEAARAQLTRGVIKPALAQGKIVIADRYYISSLAYQGYGRGIDIGFVNKVNKLATEDLEPDICFYLDIPPRVGLARKNREEMPLFSPRMEREAIQFYQRVREGYKREIQQNKRAVSLNARLSPQEISGQVTKILKEKFDL